MKELILVFMFCLGHCWVISQGMEPARKNELIKFKKGEINALAADTTTGLYEPELLQQLALNVTDATPRINIKALKLYAKIKKDKYIDFYILSSIPTVATNPEDSAKNLGNELQNLYGGLLNSYLSKTWYFNKESDFQPRGFQIDLKGGYKLTETSKNSGTSHIYLHSGQVALEMRFLIPLFGNPTDENLAGLFQLKAYGQALYSNNDDYDNFFKDENGKAPSGALFSTTAEASVHIFKQFYMSGGYSFSSIDTITDFGYFKITYSRK